MEDHGQRVVDVGEEIPLWEGLDVGSEELTELPLPEPVQVVRNVSRPTLIPVLPEGDDGTGTAVVVCPGGAFHFLSMESEGLAVGEWLRSRGHAAYVLKYRLLPTPPGRDAFAEAAFRVFTEPDRMAPLFAQHREVAAADGNRALELVRPRAERVVLLGFSAGGRLVAEALASPGSVPPDAAAIIYLPSVTAEVPAGPPLFLAAAADDPLGISGTVELLRSWSSARRPVEAHVYPAGGHGFGMRRQGLPSDAWIERFGEWLGRLS